MIPMALATDWLLPLSMLWIYSDNCKLASGVFNLKFIDPNTAQNHQIVVVGLTIHQETHRVLAYPNVHERHFQHVPLISCLLFIIAVQRISWAFDASVREVFWTIVGSLYSPLAEPGQHLPGHFLVSAFCFIYKSSFINTQNNFLSNLFFKMPNLASHYCSVSHEPMVR